MKQNMLVYIWLQIVRSIGFIIFFNCADRLCFFPQYPSWRLYHSFLFRFFLIDTPVSILIALIAYSEFPEQALWLHSTWVAAVIGVFCPICVGGGFVCLIGYLVSQQILGCTSLALRNWGFSYGAYSRPIRSPRTMYQYCSYGREQCA